MKLEIKLQQNYSRGELLLRTFFGWLYIGFPHGVCLALLGFASSCISFISWFIVLFTGKYPKELFTFQVSVLKWRLRVTSRMLNLSDGYPAFGLNVEDEFTNLEIQYPEKLSRLTLLLRAFFGVFYVMIPHSIVLFFRMLVMYLFLFLSWFIVLFTGKYPKMMHDFSVGTMRWAYRVAIYMSFLTDTYPPFSSKE